MGADIKKEGVHKIILAILFVGLILFLVQESSAQTPREDCCILKDSGICNGVGPDATYSSQEDCETADGVFKTGECSSLPNCSMVCCEKPSGDREFMLNESCMGIPGLEFPGFDSNTCVTSKCSEENTVVKGKIVYSDNTPAAGAAVVITNSSGTSKSASTGADGSFSTLCIEKNKIYTLKANSSFNSACGLIQQVTVNADIKDAGTLKLPCTNPDSDSCLTNWIVGDWSDQLHQCGNRPVTDAGNCATPSLSNKPPTYAPCTVSACGNGVLESGEECDFSASTALPANKDTCSDFVAGSQGTVTCSNTCHIITQCTNCAGACTDTKMCGVCPNCAEAPICQKVCNTDADKVDATAAGTYKAGKKGIKIDWQIPTQCESSTVTILRCEADPANPTGCKEGENQLFVASLSSSITSYTDEDNKLQSSVPKAFCYNVSVSGRTGMQQFKIYSAPLACAPIWDDECLENPNEKFCSGINLIDCQSGKKSESSQECSCGCRAATFENDVGCITPAKDLSGADSCNVCDVCSGPFGLYPYKEYYDIHQIYKTYDSCDQTMYLAGGDGSCFMDDYSEQSSVIGQIHACSGINSCYDYKTNSSCISNPCAISVVEGDCKWTNLIEGNNELGLGICVPKTEKYQDCTKCNDNALFGEYCPEDLCLKFGSNSSGTTCYYNTNKSISYRKLRIDNATCMNIRDVACETYDTENECTGQPSANFSANVIYGFGADGGRGGSSNNSVIQLSNDTYQRGKCIWVPSLSICIKDSDSAFSVNGYLDCSTSSNAANSDCFLDFTAPQTRAFILDKEFAAGGRYSKNELKKLTFNTSETVMGTYASVSNQISYPDSEYNMNIESGRIQFSGTIVDELDPGRHNLSFYSEDKSKNLEVLKTKEFELIDDLDLSSFIELKNSSAFYISSDTYLTNFTVKINYTDDELQCNVSMKDKFNDSKVLDGDGQKISPDLQWNYTYLPDGTYILKIECTDNHLQTFTKEYKNLLIEADTSIHDVYPRGGTFKSNDINIGIQTAYAAQCYYTNNVNANVDDATPPSETYPDSDDWTEYDYTGGIRHNTTISESANSQSGLYYYYSACYFENDHKWYVWNNGDVIFYAVDNLAPAIELYDYTTNSKYAESENSSDAVDNLAITIVCNDSSAALDAGTSYAFGCGEDGLGENSITVSEIYTNYTDAEEIKQVLGNVVLDSGDAYYVEAPEEYVKIYLNITATDKGGNKNNLKTFVNVRNLSYLSPTVLICDPQTEECN